MVAGNIGDLGVAAQAVKGVAAAAAAHRYFLTGGGIMPTPEIADLEESTSQRLRLGSYVARARAGGTPVAYARPDMLGILLYGAMGAKAVSAGPDPFTHTFQLAAAQPYLTFWRNVGGVLAERFTDCKIAQLVLRSTEGGVLTVETQIVGLAAQQEDANQVTAIDEGIPFVHYDAQGQLLVEGVSAASISSVVMTLSLGITAIPGDSLHGYAVSEGLITCDFETQQIIEDAALWNRLHYGAANPADHAPQTKNVLELGGAPAGLDLKWTRRDDAGAPVAPARELEITSTRVQVRSIAGYDVNASGEPMRRTVTYRAYKPAGNTGLTAILKNGVAAITPS